MVRGRGTIKTRGGQNGGVQLSSVFAARVSELDGQARPRARATPDTPDARLSELAPRRLLAQFEEEKQRGDQSWTETFRE